MVEGEIITRSVINILEDGSYPYMLVGSFSSNMYGIPRSTKDADFVIDVKDRTVMPRLMKELDHLLEFDPQSSFEGHTGCMRYEAMARSFPFGIEFFELADDPFALSRFQRRVRFHSSVLGRNVWIPTAEDVIVQKLRWGREKDRVDARDVMTVQGTALDLHYIENWCQRLNVTDRYQAVLATVPII